MKTNLVLEHLSNLFVAMQRDFGDGFTSVTLPKKLYDKLVIELMENTRYQDTRNLPLTGITINTAGRRFTVLREDK